MSCTRPADAGSYPFGRFTKSAEELGRLKLQATIAIDTERDIWKNAGLKPGMQVLDAACGPGFTACELGRFTGPDGHVTGIDLSEELITVAHQAKAAEQAGNVSFRTGNLYSLDLPDNRFDFIYARFVFQHLRKPHCALENLRRVLKPGGTLCILDVDDNWTCFAPESKAFMQFIRRTGAAQRRKGGNRQIGPQLHGLLAKAGFREIRTTVHPITTDQIGIRLFLGIAVLFRLQILNRFQKLLALPQLRKIKKASANPQAWGAAGIFACSGRKPLKGTHAI